MKSAMKKLGSMWRGTLRLLRMNWASLLLFTILASVGNVVASYTVYYSIIDVSMALRGGRYVDSVSLAASVRNPIVIVLMVIGVVLLAMLSVFQVAGISYILRRSRDGKKATVTDALGQGMYGCVRAAHPRSWLVLVMLLGLMPAVRVLHVSSNYLEFYLPEFVKSFIDASAILSGLYGALILFFFVLAVKYLFSMNYFFAGEPSFIQACRKSKSLVRKNFLFAAMAVLIIAGIFYGLNTGLSAVLSEIYVKLTSLFMQAAESNEIYDTMRGAIVSTLNRTITSELIAPVITLAAVHALHDVLLDGRADSAALAWKNADDSVQSRRFLLPLALCFAVCLGFFVFSQPETFEGFWDAPQRPMIVAHRGDSVRAPENTYPAFELAALENPYGMIELDIQKTSDGVIMVAHDDTLAKFGDARGIHEVTYDELMTIDAGSWFSEAYAGLHLSTLDEVLKLIREHEGLRVQIEIKVAEYDHHLEKELLEVLYANDMTDRCQIISLRPEPLERIKALDPSLTTVYTMSLAIGDISAYEMAEAYSVEESFITRAMVGKVHAAGKEIYAWTASSGSTIQYLVDCGVDGIVADDPIMVYQALDNVFYSGGFQRLFRMYVNMLHNF